MTDLASIQGFLFDLDGVLYVGSDVIEGAREALDSMKQRGYSRRFITNTSTLSTASLHRKLSGLGFHIEAREIISATRAALIYLQQFSDPVCHLLLADDVKQDFRQFRQSDTRADFVIIGDIGERWSYALLNRAFNLLSDGARLIAIHKNHFWQTEHGLQMDIGGFISALEYASRQTAILIGKPAADFFQSALTDLQLPPEQVAIVGDDIDTDTGGGQRAGLFGIQVKTGKYRLEYAQRSAVRPDLLIGSLAELPDLLPR